MALDPFSTFGYSNWPKAGGGVGRAFRSRQGPEPAPSEDAPTPEMIQANTEPPETAAEKETPSAVLSDPKFNEPDTLFHQEAEASVKLALPEGKKHITRTLFELFAETPKGPESISKIEVHSQPDGTAVAKLPTFKPKEHDGGPVKYFFKVTHNLAKLVSTEGLMRTVSEMALKSADHILVPGASFPKDSSFIRPAAAADLKCLESKLKEWDGKYPKKAHIVVYGHVDKDEKDGKALSERRAQSAHAFITNDATTWEKLYSTEKWGLAALQTILKDLGLYDGKDNGIDGPLTQAAFKAVQKKAGLKPETGKEDAATRKALFTEYMKGKHDIKIEESRFRSVAGHPWMGCAANNAAKVADGAAPENRRVTFILIKENSVFPIYFPCQDGNEAGCQGQCKRAGERSKPGIKCMFYDELVREEAQKPLAEAPKTEIVSSENGRISFEGFKGRGYVIKDFKKHKGGAIQLNPEEIIAPGEALPGGFNNQCVSFVRYFELPLTSSWNKGPRVCDLKPGELPEGTVVATLRDGKYYSDTSGRSHVGIYLSHEDYLGYLKSPDNQSGVWLMDQYFGARIDQRQKKYITNADEEKTGVKAKKPWTDPEGNKHELRVKWVDDGEEYFVVLTDQ